jgi:hypothetical protein
MISESFKYMFRDENWKTKLAIGGLIGIIPIFDLLLYGYMIDIMKLIYNGVDDELPEFNIIAQLIEGIFGLIISFAYILIPAITLFEYMFLIMGTSLVPDGHAMELSFITGLISIVFVVLYILEIVLITLAMPIALSHYAYTNKLSSIFEFKTILKIVKKTWLDILVFNIIFAIVIMILEVIISVIVFLCTITIILIPVAIWIGGMFLYYIYTVMGYFYGKVYLKGIDKINN